MQSKNLCDAVLKFKNYYSYMNWKRLVICVPFAFCETLQENNKLFIDTSSLEKCFTLSKVIYLLQTTAC